jgi:DNA-binding transcriptional LysR family regulator
MLNYNQLSRVDLNLLLVFDLLYAERHSARAAARLHLSPSAISHALRRLRSLLGDPLFIPTGKGMVPTAGAERLAPAVRDIVERVGRVIAAAERFDPATAGRRFRIAAPDGSAPLIVPHLMRILPSEAPGIDLAILQLLPRAGAAGPEQAWRDAFTDLDASRVDLVIVPHRPSQARFHAVPLYSEEFVFVTRRGHRLGDTPSLKQIAASSHLLVSATGDSSGLVDRLLAERGLERRIALTVPSFLMAVAAIASSDLIAALPRRFAQDAASNYDIAIIEPPFPMLPGTLYAVVMQAALLDQGVAWLVDLFERSLDNRGHD